MYFFFYFFFIANFYFFNALYYDARDGNGVLYVYSTHANTSYNNDNNAVRVFYTRPGRRLARQRVQRTFGVRRLRALVHDAFHFESVGRIYTVKTVCFRVVYPNRMGESRR